MVSNPHRRLTIAMKGLALVVLAALLATLVLVALTSCATAGDRWAASSRQRDGDPFGLHQFALDPSGRADPAPHASHFS